MDCTKCPVSGSCFGPCMFGKGKKTARIMFVSDNPSSGEDKNDEWVSDKAGRLLTDLLTSVGIDPKVDCYFTGVTKCATPPDVKGNPRLPTKEEIDNCSVYLEKELELVNPEIIVPMGNIALKVLAKHTGITKYRGKAEKVGERIIFPIVHPSMVFKQPKHPENFVTDIVNLKKVLDTGEDSLESADVDYRYLETRDDIVNEIERMYNDPASPYLVFDIETTGLNPFLKGQKIVALSLTDKSHYGVTIPIEHKDFNWSPEDFEVIIEKIKWLLECAHLKRVGHNGKFDKKWLKAKYGINVANYAFDPMLAHYITVTEERGGHGLKELAWEHTDMGGYDNALDEFKMTLPESQRGNYENIPWEILRTYAAADVDCTFRLIKVFEEKLDQHPKWRGLYKLYLDASYALCDMESNGIKIDRKRLEEFDEAYRNEIESIKHKLQEYPEVVMIEREKRKLYELRQLEMKKPKDERDPEILKYNKYKNFEFNFGSVNNLRELLFDKLGLETPYKTDKGQLSTGKETLEYLEGKHPITTMLSRWRKLEKLFGTYISPAFDWIGEDGLVHPSSNLTGCLSGDTLVLTNKGEIRTDQLADYNVGREKSYTTLLDPELEVYDGHEYRKPLGAFYNGERDVVTITTEVYEKTITCTLNHRLGGINGWIEALNLVVGDTLLVFDDDGVPLPDKVAKIERGVAETFDLVMDDYDEEQFKSMEYIVGGD